MAAISQNSSIWKKHITKINNTTGNQNCGPKPSDIGPKFTLTISSHIVGEIFLFCPEPLSRKTQRPLKNKSKLLTSVRFQKIKIQILLIFKIYLKQNLNPESIIKTEIKGIPHCSEKIFTPEQKIIRRTGFKLQLISIRKTARCAKIRQLRRNF